MPVHVQIPSGQDQEGLAPHPGQAGQLPRLTAALTHAQKTNGRLHLGIWRACSQLPLLLARAFLSCTGYIHL